MPSIKDLILWWENTLVAICARWSQWSHICYLFSRMRGRYGKTFKIAQCLTSSAKWSPKEISAADLSSHQFCNVGQDRPISDNKPIFFVLQVMPIMSPKLFFLSRPISTPPLLSWHFSSHMKHSFGTRFHCVSSFIYLFIYFSLGLGVQLHQQVCSLACRKNLLLLSSDQLWELQLTAVLCWFPRVRF